MTLEPFGLVEAWSFNTRATTNLNKPNAKTATLSPWRFTNNIHICVSNEDAPGSPKIAATQNMIV